MCNGGNSIKKERGREGETFRNWMGVGQWEGLLIHRVMRRFGHSLWGGKTAERSPGSLEEASHGDIWAKSNPDRTLKLSCQCFLRAYCYIFIPRWHWKVLRKELPLCNFHFKSITLAAALRTEHRETKMRSVRRLYSSRGNGVGLHLHGENGSCKKWSDSR